MDQNIISGLELLIERWQQKVASYGTVSKRIDRIAYASKHQASLTLSKLQQALRNARKGV